MLQNILDIEVKLFANEENNDDTTPIKYTHMLEENANLCFKIFNAVKRLQEDLDKVRQQQKDDDKEEEEGLVNLVRSSQFDNIKTAYIEAYWKYNAVVRRYEDKISDESLVGEYRTNTLTQLVIILSFISGITGRYHHSNATMRGGRSRPHLGSNAD